MAACTARQGIAQQCSRSGCFHGQPNEGAGERYPQTDADPSMQADLLKEALGKK
jgi:hypothetical protein